MVKLCDWSIIIIIIFLLLNEIYIAQVPYVYAHLRITRYQLIYKVLWQ